MGKDAVTSGSQLFENLFRAGKLLTVTDLAKLLSVRPKLIYSWVYKGEIEAIKLGPKLIRFSPEYIARWISRKGEITNGDK